MQKMDNVTLCIVILKKERDDQKEATAFALK